MILYHLSLYNIFPTKKFLLFSSVEHANYYPLASKIPDTLNEERAREQPNMGIQARNYDVLVTIPARNFAEERTAKGRCVSTRTETTSTFRTISRKQNKSVGNVAFMETNAAAGNKTNLDAVLLFAKLY